MRETTLESFSFQKYKNMTDKKCTFLGCVILVLAAGILSYNAFYGLCNSDESFYLTIPYRILKGDALFINEWHVSQLSSVLQFPIVWLFVKATGTCDGIILFFRFLFIIYQLGVSLFAFAKMRRYGFVSALIGALLFELYTPEYVLSLSYFSLSLLPVTLISLLLVFEENPSPIKLITVGILLACAVLAEPGLAVLFFVYLGVVLFSNVSKRLQNSLFSFKSFVFIATGVFIVFVGFLVFLLLQETLPAFLSALPNIFKSGEYSQETLFSGYYDFIVSLFRDYSWFSIVMGIFLLVVFLDKNVQKRKMFYAFVEIGIAIACVSIGIIKSFKSGKPTPFINLPFVVAFLGISSYRLLNEKKTELLHLWLFGFSYFFCLAITSEAMGYDGSYGFVISCLASVPLILSLNNELISENKKESRNKKINKRLNLKRSVDKHTDRRTIHSGTKLRIIRVLTFISIALCLSIVSIYAGMLLTRDPAMTLFYERKIMSETVMVDKGAYKLIRVSPEQKMVYDAILRDVEYIESQTDEKYTVLSDDPWCVLSSNRAPLAFTLWYIPGIENTYLEYYRYLNETPKYIYIVNHWLYGDNPTNKFSIDQPVSFFSNAFDCEQIEGEAGTILKVLGYRNTDKT